MTRNVEALIERAIDAGRYDLADAAIAALDALEDSDREAEDEDGESCGEILAFAATCPCCRQPLAVAPWHLA